MNDGDELHQVNCPLYIASGCSANCICPVEDAQDDVAGLDPIKQALEEIPEETWETLITKTEL